MDNASFFFSIFDLNGRSWILDQSMIFATTYLIYLTFLLVFILGLKGGIREKKALLLILLGLPIAVLLIKIIHFFFFEPRPFVAFHFSPIVMEAVNSASFPSRHATLIAVLAFTYIYFKSKWSLLFLPIMLWIGFSRVYVGVHYPLDVIGGFAVGAVSVFIALQIKRLLKKRLLPI
ncbi:MAG: phosphatase PAP2 family protein [Candidatus Levybacteria bacterium]|nr:phosphatase PAP2 family protein [Candidatus Levybacteria bacterium]